MYTFWKRTLPSAWRNRLMTAFYGWVARLDAGGDLPFLNHGYAPPDGDPLLCSIAPEDAPNRYWIALYALLAEKADWRGAAALEVSSGHGGGADWLARTHAPKAIVGVDIAPPSVALAARRFQQANLRFQTGDAQALPFEAEAFDIVISVESSLNYPDFKAFLQEVDRVLKPGGMFLIADYRSWRKRGRFESRLAAMGYDRVWRADIREGVVRAHALTAPAKVAIIEAKAPRLLRPLLRRFADLKEDGGVSGRRRFETGRRVYLAYALRKPGRDQPGAP